MADVVWNWVSKHAGNVTDRRGEPTTVVWPRDIGTFLGGDRIEVRWHLRALKASGLRIAPRPGTYQQYVKVSDGRFAVAYVFACAPENVPRIERAAETQDSERTAGRLVRRAVTVSAGRSRWSRRAAHASS